LGLIDDNDDEFKEYQRDFEGYKLRKLKKN